MQKPQCDYSSSHTSVAHGTYYDKTYESGFYKYQWINLEKPLLEKIFRELCEKGLNNYLDFACGTGRITKLGEKYFSQCYGVDISDEMLVVARKRCKKSILLKHDLAHEILEQKFDVITSFRFFLNAEKALKTRILNAINEMLTDDGCLIVNIHVNSNSILGFAYRIRNRILNRDVANTMSMTEFETYLNNAGFIVSNVHWYSYLPRVGWRFSWLYKFIMLPFEKICLSLHLLPKSMAQSFLVVAHKNNY